MKEFVIILAMFLSFLGIFFFGRRLKAGPKPPYGQDYHGRPIYGPNIYQASIFYFLVGLFVTLVGGLIFGVKTPEKDLDNLLYFLAAIPIAIAIEICLLDSDQLRDKRLAAFMAAFIGGMLLGIAIL